MYPHVEVDASQYLQALRAARRLGPARAEPLGADGRSPATNTPIYERYYAGGFSTLRGFAFRGVSPRRSGHGRGGSAATSSCSASVQYLFPITRRRHAPRRVLRRRGHGRADDPRNGTRSPRGAGLRPADHDPDDGPGAIALDFAFPVAKQPGDQRRSSASSSALAAANASDLVGWVAGASRRLPARIPIGGTRSSSHPTI